MSFPNPPPPPPPHFMPMPFFDGDVGGFWPQFPVDQFSLEQYPMDHPNFSLNHEHPDIHGQFEKFEHAPPFKRPRSLENNPSNSAQFPPRLNPPNLPGSKGTSHIFYKTRMCAKFLEGNCKNGEHCTFAHGMEDLREPLPYWQELVREKDASAGNWNDDHRLIHKMKICKKFYNGEECPYGEKCNFLHERSTSSFHEERPRFKTDMARQRERESSAISIGTRGPASGNRVDADQLDINKPPMNPNLAKSVFWKTKLCSKWEVTGHCPFGERCHFAHGLSELQVSSSRIDVEVAVNSGPVQMKPLAVPISDSSLADAVVGVPTMEEGEQKDISKWKLSKKINRIYADWIDDLTPPHSFPSEAES